MEKLWGGDDLLLDPVITKFLKVSLLAIEKGWKNFKCRSAVSDSNQIFYCPIQWSGLMPEVVTGVDELGVYVLEISWEVVHDV